jgi:hypothetical protein
VGDKTLDILLRLCAAVLGTANLEWRVHHNAIGLAGMVLIA